MKRRWMLIFGAVLLASQVSAEDAPVLKTQKDKENYGIGVSTARNFKRQGIEVDLDIFLKGVKDGLSGGKLLMTEKDLRKTMTAFQEDLRKKQKYAIQVAAVENRKNGDAFLAENGKKDGVVTLSSGLQYKVLKAGDGAKPTDNNTAVCRYRGALLDGTEFDGTDPEGPPANLKVGEGIIRGLREALKLMPSGSKWEIYVPPQLAYGERGVGVDIGPNATLIFELELLAVK